MSDGGGGGEGSGCNNLHFSKAYIIENIRKISEFTCLIRNKNHSFKSFTKYSQQNIPGVTNIHMITTLRKQA